MSPSVLNQRKIQTFSICMNITTELILTAARSLSCLSGEHIWALLINVTELSASQFVLFIGLWPAWTWPHSDTKVKCILITILSLQRLWCERPVWVRANIGHSMVKHNPAHIPGLVSQIVLQIYPDFISQSWLAFMNSWSVVLSTWNIFKLMSSYAALQDKILKNSQSSFIAMEKLTIIWFWLKWKTQEHKPWCPDVQKWSIQFYTCR